MCNKLSNVMNLMVITLAFVISYIPTYLLFAFWGGLDIVCTHYIIRYHSMTMSVSNSTIATDDGIMLRCAIDTYSIHRYRCIRRRSQHTHLNCLQVIWIGKDEEIFRPLWIIYDSALAASQWFDRSWILQRERYAHTCTVAHNYAIQMWNGGNHTKDKFHFKILAFIYMISYCCSGAWGLGYGMARYPFIHIYFCFLFSAIFSGYTIFACTFLLSFCGKAFEKLFHLQK